MKLEKFNYSNGKRSRWFLYGFIMCAVLMVLINLFLSQAKYLNTESIKLVEGNISYKPNELNIVAVNIENDNGEYIYSEDIPTSGYYLDDSKSYCEVKNIKDNSIKIEYTGSKLEVTDISKKGTRCYAYFNKSETKTCPSGASSCETIMANTNTIGERTDFSKTVTVTTTGVMYQAEDDYGTSYYFAGAPTDNWVKFGNFYWRIIRINGDGTIRMIYSGNATSGPAIVGLATQIGTSPFNENYIDNAYVGYMYTSGNAHGTGTASTIKGVLDSWYNSNLASYASYIATGGGATFCNDRQPSTSDSSSNGSGGTETTETYYAPFIRLYAGWSSSNASPSFKCADSGDRFSTSIGLITADEVSYAGGVVGTNNFGYYLYTDQYYWTMSPYSFYESWSEAHVFLVLSSGNLDSYYGVNWARPGVRLVINLKADTAFSNGTGTIDNPYIVS